ncbi:MAG: hypothetical protein JST00_08290 [Deltaproteobacteria bacterium]|nr:hypothetical protein [Deltaproteobacteria bacterium]
MRSPRFVRQLSSNTLVRGVAAAVLVGCTSETIVTPAGESRAEVPSEPAGPSTEPPPSSEPPAVPGCTTPAAKAATVDEATLGRDAAGTGRVWLVRASEGGTMVSLTVQEAAGAKPGASGGSWGAEQLTPRTAPVRVWLQKDCRAHGDHFHCGPSFVATSGTWSFAKLGGAVGEEIEVSISGSFTQATQKSGKVTPVAGGPGLCLDGLRLKGTLAAP